VTTLPVRRLDDWIESYLHFTRYHIAVEKFHLWSALGVLGVAINKSRWIDSGYRKTYPNLYILLVGPSGVGKSYSSDLAFDILRESKAKVKIFSDSITAAGLVEFMGQSTITYEIDGRIIVKTPVSVYASEIGTMLTRRNSLEELAIILTELFNRDTDYESTTKGTNKTTIKGPNLSFFACCPPEWILENLTSVGLKNGFLGRMLIVTDSKKRFHESQLLGQLEWNLRDDLIHDLQVISNQSVQMIWSTEANKAYDGWVITQPLDLTSDETIEVQGFVSRKSQFVKKLAILFAVSRKSTLNVIELCDLERAFELLETCEENARALKVKPPHVSHTEKMRHVILMLEKKIGKGSLVPIRDIMPRVYRQMKKEEIETAIETLCHIGFCKLDGRKLKVVDRKVGG
jgi:hypothetical protein